VEITNLLVTDENDSEEQVRELVEWAASVSRDLPLHLSRYRPTYRHERAVRRLWIGSSGRRRSRASRSTTFTLGM
jgi:pyruvate-formate lyase-activating enzyme